MHPFKFYYFSYSEVSQSKTDACLDTVQIVCVLVQSQNTDFISKILCSFVKWTNYELVFMPMNFSQCRWFYSIFGWRIHCANSCSLLIPDVLWINHVDPSTTAPCIDCVICHVSLIHYFQRIRTHKTKTGHGMQEHRILHDPCGVEWTWIPTNILVHMISVHPVFCCSSPWFNFVSAYVLNFFEFDVVISLLQDKYKLLKRKL